jgi:hypothetical protein
VAGLRTCQRLLLTLLVLTAALVAVGPTGADEVPRFDLSTSSNVKPIMIGADDVVTWTEAGEQVFLLRGKVLIAQGVVEIRSERAVLWVDFAIQRKTGEYRAQLIADGNVRVEGGPGRRSAATALVELATRQDVSLRPGTRTVQQPQGADPFFRRALELRTKAPAASPIQLTAGAAPADPAQRSGGAPPAPGTPLPALTVPGIAAPMPGPPAGPPGASGPPYTLSVQRRTAALLDVDYRPMNNGESAAIISGGIILTVRSGPKDGLIDIEADRMVIWTRGDSRQLFNQLQTPEGHTGQEVEFYLEGNVEIRTVTGASQTTMKADRVYYDVRRKVAIALEADLELRRRGIPEPLHLQGRELYQVSQTRFEAVQAKVFSSRLPSDPGLQVVMARATIEDKEITRQTIFGRPVMDSKTGEQQTYVERLMHGEDVVLRLEDVPIFYLPVIQGDANDPLGPLQSLGFKNDRIFGVQVVSTFDVWNLLNRNPVPGTRWTMEADYLSRRGPALGTNFEYFGRDLFGLPGPYRGLVKLYGIHDDGTDILGGGRGENDEHPDWRGRLLFRHNQTFLEEYTLQTQVSLLSDKNFLEQYYKPEFDGDLNQQTFLYFRQIHENYSWSGLIQPRVRNWVTEDVWLPRVDGSILGQSFFNLFTYNLTANAGYAELRPTSVPPPPTSNQPTDRNDATGRFDVRQELGLPFYLGPVRVVPYGVLDLAYYTDNLNGDADGRLYGAGGVRSSLPLTRLYPNVQSELFNLNGINHKIVLSGNYFIAHSSDPFTDFPQLDRLNDDATDQALRDITPRQTTLNPAHGLALATSPIFNTQTYAIRRLVDNRVDTLDTIEVLQADLRQRWQTKRGFPGQEHVIDYLTLDVSASFFPHPDRDNFGKNYAFLEYDTTWNVGDRTAITSSGWYDPFDNGARVFTIGAFLNRTDRTSFFVGYRLIDPIDSRALTTAATYVFSPKYAITASSTYDFGINESLSNSLVVTRMGSDLTLSLGITYNAILKNFGFTMELLPNFVAVNRQTTSGMLSRGLLR